MSGTDGEWEYETLRPPRGATKKEAIDPKAQLNELGGDGWELVTSVEYVGGGTKYLVFKRPADTDNNETGDGERGNGDGDTESETDSMGKICYLSRVKAKHGARETELESAASTARD